MNLWIADIDGVFTDLLANPDDKAINLSAEIGHNCPFTYITGRSANWLEQNFLPSLAQAYQQYKPYQTLVGAEYGAIMFSYQDGNWQKIHEDRNPLSRKLRTAIRSAIDKIPGVFFDATKEIMISVEAQHSMRQNQPRVVEQGIQKAERILKNIARESPGLEYQRTTYACDLVPEGLNKSHGAGLVLEQIDFTPSHIHLLGDAPSDLLLIDAVKNLPHTMHYVGDPKKLSAKQKALCSINPTNQLYNFGTIEVLRNFT